MYNKYCEQKPGAGIILLKVVPSGNQIGVGCNACCDDVSVLASLIPEGGQRGDMLGETAEHLLHDI